MTPQAADDRPQHAFTVDLEEWFHGIELPPEEWPDSSRLKIGLDRTLALLNKHDVRLDRLESQASAGIGGRDLDVVFVGLLARRVLLLNLNPFLSL